MARRSIRTSLIAWGGLCLLILGAGISIFSVITIKNIGMDHGVHVIRNQALNYSRFIKIQLTRAEQISKLLANMMNGIVQPLHPLSIEREHIDQMLCSIVNKEPSTAAAFTCWEPDAFDHKDSAYADEPGHDQTGRFMSYWYRNQSGLIDVKPYVSVLDNAAEEFDIHPDGSGEIHAVKLRFRRIDTRRIPVISRDQINPYGRSCLWNFRNRSGCRRI